MIKKSKTRSLDNMHSFLLIFACNFPIDNQYVQNKALVSIKKHPAGKVFFINLFSISKSCIDKIRYFFQY